MIGVEERKAVSKGIAEKKPNAEKIKINGTIGYFQEWSNNGEGDSIGKKITGGKLSWVQEGTYIEMDSSNIIKDKMIEIARSMK
jgi:hypothetical protein